MPLSLCIPVAPTLLSTAASIDHTQALHHALCYLQLILRPGIVCPEHAISLLTALTFQSEWHVHNMLVELFLDCHKTVPERLCLNAELTVSVSTMPECTDFHKTLQARL